MIQILIDFFKMIVEFIKPYHYMLWKLILHLPVWIKSLIEILFFIIIIFVIHKIGKLILQLICKCIQAICYIFTRIFLDVILEICGKISGENGKNKLLQLEKRADEFGNESKKFFTELRVKIKGHKLKFSKKVFVCIGICYIWLCLPEVGFVKSLDVTYQPIFTFASDTMQRAVAAITPDIEMYPDIFEEQQNDIIETEKIYLVLNENGRTGSNVRSGPSKGTKSMGVVTENNTIIYEGSYERDGNRYWLLVSAEGIEGQGWISSYLIEEDCLAQIGLQ